MASNEELKGRLSDVSHSLKGLCGIFSLVEAGLPDDEDLRQVFSGGLTRMREIIEKLDQE